MSNDQPVIPNHPIPVDNPNKTIDHEKVLKETFSEERLKHLNAGNTEFILPDDVEVKDKKKKD